MAKEEKQKINEEELDKIQEELEQQKEDTPDEERVNKHMEQMAYLWDKVHQKLYQDNTCFHTKKPLVKDGEDPKNVGIHVVEATQVEPGIVAFVSLSNEAYKELQAKQEEEQKEEKKE